MALSKEDPIEALITFQKHIETFETIEATSYKWVDYLYSKLPTSLLPKTMKNAEVINTILIKSWEIQGSFSKLPGSAAAPLMSRVCREIHVFLMYYFKSMNIADNMERIIGSVDLPPGFGPPFVHSFLKIDDHIIDNTIDVDKIEYWKNIPIKTFEWHSAWKYNDGDPADPKHGVLPQSSDIGLGNERRLYGNDEKAEQISVYLEAMAFLNEKLTGSIMYDTEMRKFIKEKYGVEIESLAKKWSKLCWNCFAAVENLKKCSKCRIARYCGKDCQAQDWKKVHKIHSSYIKRFVRIDM